MGFKSCKTYAGLKLELNYSVKGLVLIEPIGFVDDGSLWGDLGLIGYSWGKLGFEGHTFTVVGETTLIFTRVLLGSHF